VWNGWGSRSMYTQVSRPNYYWDLMWSAVIRYCKPHFYVWREKWPSASATGTQMITALSYLTLCLTPVTSGMPTQFRRLPLMIYEQLGQRRASWGGSVWCLSKATQLLNKVNAYHSVQLIMLRNSFPIRYIFLLRTTIQKNETFRISSKRWTDLFL